MCSIVTIFNVIWSKPFLFAFHSWGFWISDNVFEHISRLLFPLPSMMCLHHADSPCIASYILHTLTPAPFYWRLTSVVLSPRGLLTLELYIWFCGSLGRFHLTIIFITVFFTSINNFFFYFRLVALLAMLTLPSSLETSTPKSTECVLNLV